MFCCACHWQSATELTLWGQSACRSGDYWTALSIVCAQARGFMQRSHCLADERPVEEKISLSDFVIKVFHSARMRFCGSSDKQSASSCLQFLEV